MSAPLARLARGTLSLLGAALVILPLATVATAAVPRQAAAQAARPARSGARPGAIRTPDAALGIDVGADRTLADWTQIVRYFHELDAASPAVRVDSLGLTTQGRPFIMAAISTPANIARLEQIRRAQARLADPRGLSVDEERAIVASQPSVIMISCNIHATEIASSQMAMELAHRLATNDTLQRALKDVVVLLVPSMNPDGQFMVTDWYRKNVGTQWEGGPIPWLSRYARRPLKS